MQTVSILGTDYTIETQSVSENPKLAECSAYCDQYAKKIILSDLEEEKNDLMCVGDVANLNKQILRHEIIHGFFGESGLRTSSDYAENEELVDWIAIQFPKMLKAFQDVGAL